MRVTAIDRCVESLRPEMVAFISRHRLREIRFYAEHGMPAYAYGPGLLSVSHGPKEFVNIDRVVDGAPLYARVGSSMLRPSGQKTA